MQTSNIIIEFVPQTNPHLAHSLSASSLYLKFGVINEK